MNFPPDFPKHLKPGVHAAVIKAQRRLPKQKLSIERVMSGISAFAEAAIRAVKEGEWDVGSAYTGIQDFLATLCIEEVQRDHIAMLSTVFSYETQRITLAITNSRKWIDWLERLDELATGKKSSTEKISSIPARKVNQIKDSVSKQIDDLREECRLTVEELAEAVGLSARSVYRHLSGDANPRKRHLNAYERIFSARLKRDVRLNCQVNVKRQ
jgi:DNA-binding XRE family transcriptional regulator